MSLKYFFIAIRPKTLVASIFPVTSSILLAIHEGYFKPLVALATLLCALSLQSLTNIANDYFDYLKGADSHERIGPQRVTQSGLLSTSNMKQLILLNTFLSLFLGVFLVLQGGFLILVIGVFSILFAIGYTAGPFPLAYLGLGEIFSFMFFGIIASAGTYYLQADQLSVNSIAVGAIYGFLSVALISANNIRDIEADKKANKKTIVVRFGIEFGKKVLYISLLTPICALPFFVYLNWIPWASLLSLFSYKKFIQAFQLTQKSNSNEFNLVFPVIIQYYLLYGSLFIIGQIIEICMKIWN